MQVNSKGRASRIYANECPSQLPPQSQPLDRQPLLPNSTNPGKPVPIPGNSRPVRKIDIPDAHSTVDPVVAPSASDAPINHFEEDDIITHGLVNGIDTPVVIASGAKISVISDDFIELHYEPVHFTTIFGISQEPKSVPVFSLAVKLPTLEGKCLLAVDSRLPPRTVLLGLDFGSHNNITALINHIKF